MHVYGPILQTFPDFLNREPASREIGQQIASHGPRIGPEEKCAQAKNPAKNRGRQLRFPFLFFMGVFEEFDVALDHARPGDVPPTPELWRSRTGHTRDRCFAS